MEKLAKQAGQSGGQGGMPMPWGEPSGESGEDEGPESDGVRHDRVEIRTPSLPERPPSSARSCSTR